MALFQPFGYSVEINSSIPVDDAKASIRKKKKGWFEVKNGARGWILGSIICLWLSAFDRQGPMFLGWIGADANGTKIRGRAGSDLNGVLMFSLLVPLLAFLTFAIIRDGSATPGLIVVMFFLVLIGGPLVYWSAHTDRHAADGLVRFLADAVASPQREKRSRLPAGSIPKNLAMDVNGKIHPDPLTEQAIYDALLATGVGEPLILSTAPEIYMQTLSRDGRFVLEKREGSVIKHFRATRRSPIGGAQEVPKDLFTVDEVLAALIAFATNENMPDIVQWERMQC